MSDLVIRHGFQSISYELPFTNDKGKKLYESGHVENVEELKFSYGWSNIKGTVIRQTSVTLEPWTVSLEIDETRSIKSASCGCPAGAGAKCKHIAAIICYINNEDGRSKTDLPQQWGIPTESIQHKYKKGKKIEDLFPSKRQKIDSSSSVCHSMLIANHHILNIPCTLSNMLKITSLNEVERECRLCLNDIIGNIENQLLIDSYQKHFSLILFNQKNNDINLKLSYMFPLKLNESNYYFENINVDKNECFNIFIKTLNQANSSFWFKNRKHRISASSKAHKIKVCRNWTPAGQIHLANTFLKTANLGKTGTINVTYGKNTEVIAIKTYEQIFNKVVIKCGLVINPLIPWLCASPDGLVLTNGEISAVLEIKCPISCINKNIIENGVPNLKYLFIDNKEIKLKKSSMYYTQCQILMYCTGLLECEFFIYNNVEPLAITIERDDIFLINIIKKMEIFFYNYYLPRLSNSL